MEVIRGSLYDYPLYYDLVFGADWQTELRFLDECFTRYVVGRAKSVFEPACGSGRLLYRLARRGYDVSGLDLNEPSVRFCNERLKRMGFPPSVSVGDMSRFVLDKPVDAAFNLINSFRHLPSEEAAYSHLEAMAQAVRPGGIYVLGLHLTPLGHEPLGEETWHVRRGNLAIDSSLWTIERNLRSRQERCSISVDVYTPARCMRIEDQILLRTYTWSQFESLLDLVPQWGIVDAFDFACDLGEPVDPDDDCEDVVFILRRRA